MADEDNDSAPSSPLRKVERKGRFTIIDLPTSPQSSNDPNDDHTYDSCSSPTRQVTSTAATTTTTSTAIINSRRRRSDVHEKSDSPKKSSPSRNHKKLSRKSGSSSSSRPLVTRVERKGRFTIIEHSSGHSPTRQQQHQNSTNTAFDKLKNKLVAEQATSSNTSSSTTSRPAWVFAKNKSLRSTTTSVTVSSSSKKLISQLIASQQEMQATLQNVSRASVSQPPMTCNNLETTAGNNNIVSELYCRIEDLLKENKALEVALAKSTARVKEVEDARKNELNIVTELQLKCVRLERKVLSNSLATAHDGNDDSH